MSRSLWAERASRLRIANRAVMVAARGRRTLKSGHWNREHPSFAEWEARVGEFWAAMRATYPPEFWEAFELLKAGDDRAADAAIEFLEADPICFRSGYLKADVVRFLGRLQLNSTQVSRLRNVVIEVASTRYGREFRRYCSLARRIDGPEFRRRLESLAASDNADVRRRAGWVTAALR